MSSDKFKIEINGVEFETSPGQMIIEVTDAADVYVPRFCYHKKLSVAANCRMCLVEVEKAPKPLPACATPVADGMKIFTKSAAAIAAQKSVMEFLLINHPLDCPICDQGGECELQDIAMGYGRGISRFTEQKRVVQDQDLGPLISTDMTRCIHCTRCVRFGQEIAGIQELGTIGRGEDTLISTYIESSVDHELSGNIIDVCPVGALNNKPYRFSARAWEMVQLPTVSPHDCAGSNMNAHVMQGTLKRIVPRVNESINETWIADRDRFSCEAVYADDRLTTPMIRAEDGEWRACSWDEGLEAAVEGLQRVSGQLAGLVSPSATTEEGYLAARLLRHLGSENLDHRLRRVDFRQQDLDPVFPWLGMSLEDIEQLKSILVIGSNLRREVPILAHRVRKAAMDGATVSFLNRQEYEYLFPVGAYLQNDDLVGELSLLVRAAAGKGADLSPAIAKLVGAAKAPSAAHQDIVTSLRERGGIFLGQISLRHPRFAELRLLGAELARLTGAQLGYVPEGANAAGLSLAGVLPHRGIGGKAIAKPGAAAAEIIARPPKGLFLIGVEPDLDCVPGPDAVAAMKKADFVLALTPFAAASLMQHADVLLPMGTFAETSGTFVNVSGQWQSFSGVARPVAESRPGWKILRVLGNLLELPDCDYVSSEEVRDELQQAVENVVPDNGISLDKAVAAGPKKVPADTQLDVPMYSIDSLVRRAHSLQCTRDAQAGSVSDIDERINSA
jgi:NADH-quinone oxidoreductase subunit G